MRVKFYICDWLVIKDTFFLLSMWVNVPNYDNNGISFKECVLLLKQKITNKTYTGAAYDGISITKSKQTLKKLVMTKSSIWEDMVLWLMSIFSANAEIYKHVNIFRKSNWKNLWSHGR